MPASPDKIFSERTQYIGMGLEAAISLERLRLVVAGVAANQMIVRIQTSNVTGLLDAAPR